MDFDIIQECARCPKITKSCLNGVEVAQIGLILCVDGATGGRKVLGYLPGLLDPIKLHQRDPN